MFWVKYREVEISCETADEALELARSISPKPAHAQVPVVDPAKLKPLEANVGAKSKRFLAALISAKGAPVSLSKLNEQFGYSGDRQIAGLVSAVKKALKRAGVDPAEVLKFEEGAGREISYSVAPDAVEKVRSVLAR